MAVHTAARDRAPDDVITTTALVKTYRQGTAEVRALDEVSVGVRRARFTAVVGPSGSGKSTLMHCAAGLDTLTSGTDEMLDDFKSTVEEDVKQTLRTAADEAIEEIGRMAEALEAAAVAARREREEVASGVDDTGQRSPILQSGVEQVKVAANQVGLPWS